MNDESDEFLELFNEELTYFDGAKTQSGFYTVEKAAFSKKFDFINDINFFIFLLRLFRAFINGVAIEMETVSFSPDSLDPRFVFLLDAGNVIWIWSGLKSRVIFGL